MLGSVYRRVLYACAVGAALLLGATALLVTGDVLARNLGLGSLPWILEISEYVLPLATFLVAPWLLYRNQHVRLDVLLAAAPRALAHRLECAADFAGLLVCAVFVVYGIRAAADSARADALVIKSLVFPEWWLYAPVPVCFGLLAIEFLQRLARGGTPAAASQG